MFGMNQKMMETLLKNQIKNLKRIRVEIEKKGEKKLCQIVDQDIKQGQASFFLKESDTGEEFTLRLRL